MCILPAAVQNTVAELVLKRESLAPAIARLSVIQDVPAWFRLPCAKHTFEAGNVDALNLVNRIFLNF